MMSIASKLGMVLIAAVVTLSAASVEAQIFCGAVVTKDTIMGNDISCPAHDPAFTVQGPAKVDMSGHKVAGCKGVGILITGQGASVQNGAVQECFTGIEVAGAGGHTLVNMVASANQSNGFLIESSNNTIEKSVADYNLLNGFLTFSFSPLTGNTLQENVAYLNNGEGFNFGGTKGSYNNNTATLNDGNGFRLVGDDNVFLRNTAANNDSDGFYVLGSTNRLFENTASDNQGVGFLVVGSTTVNNKLVRNISIGNALHGFEVNDNTVASDNVTVANEKQGFKAAGAGATLTGNTSVFHFFPGIESTGGNSNVKGNRSYGNDTGISIGTAGNTSILSNLALGNVLDVKDQAAMCSGHTWSSNVFGSGSPACVK